MAFDRATNRVAARVALGVGILLIVATVVAGRAAGEVGQCTDVNIIDLEMSGFGIRAEDILAGCNDTAALRDALDADSFFFVPAYVATLVWFTTMRRRSVSPGIGLGAARTLHRAAVAAVAAGVLDLIENAALRRVLDAPTDSGGAQLVATGMAVPKFALVAFALVTAIAALGALVRASFSARGAERP